MRQMLGRLVVMLDAPGKGCRISDGAGFHKKFKTYEAMFAWLDKYGYTTTHEEETDETRVPGR